MLIRRMREILNDPNSPVLPLLDRSKTEAFLAAPKELGKPWFGQLMAGPQLIAYFIQINTWMQIYHCPSDVPTPDIHHSSLKRSCPAKGNSFL